jgi:hypothetical protein
MTQAAYGRGARAGKRAAQFFRKGLQNLSDFGGHIPFPHEGI